MPPKCLKRIAKIFNNNQKIFPKTPPRPEKRKRSGMSKNPQASSGMSKNPQNPPPPNLSRNLIESLRIYRDSKGEEGVRCYVLQI